MLLGLKLSANYLHFIDSANLVWLKAPKKGAFVEAF
jgi:hypothetical protein